MAISHKRDTNARRTPSAALVAGPLALLATATAVTARRPRRPAGARTATRRRRQRRVADVARPRAATVSRSESRARPRRARSAAASSLERAYHVDMSRAADAGGRPRRRHQRRWTTAPLNLWTNPGDRAPPSSAWSTTGEGPRHRPARHGPRRDRRRRQGPLGHRRLPRRRPSRSWPRPWRRSGPPRSARRRPAPRRRPGAGLSTAPCPDGSVESGLTSRRRHGLPRGVPRLPADHDVRRLRRARRARLGPGDRHHDQRQGAGRPDRGVPPGARLRARTSTTSSGGTRSGRRSGPPRAGATTATTGRPPPTTWTTCTSPTY